MFGTRKFQFVVLVARVKYCSLVPLVRLRALSAFIAAVASRATLSAVGIVIDIDNRQLSKHTDCTMCATGLR